jgi:hypothetical protein
MSDPLETLAPSRLERIATVSLQSVISVDGWRHWTPKEKAQYAFSCAVELKRLLEDSEKYQSQ